MEKTMKAALAGELGKPLAIEAATPDRFENINAVFERMRVEQIQGRVVLASGS